MLYPLSLQTGPMTRRKAPPAPAAPTRASPAAALFGVALLSACAPKVVLPVAPEILSAEWRGSAGDPVRGPARADSLGALLASQELERLIRRAQAANADLAAAAARIGQARAQLDLARASMLPVISGTAGLAATRTDDSGGSAFDFSDAFAGIDASYEIDLFGSARAERRAARARLAATTFDREALALVIATDIARIFVQHAALADRLTLLDRSLANARELERIIGVRRRLGVATLVETGLQANEVRQLEAERSRLVEAQARTRNALAILVGEEAPLFAPPPATVATFTVPAILPDSPGPLLVRRPDIRAAETRIAAASGDVAQARAAFLPRLSVTGSALGQAAALSGPFGATLTAGASLVAPIFDRGRLRGGLALATATQLETVELYRKALLTALAEVEDALAAVEQARRREALLAGIVEEAQRTRRLVRLQYIEGEADLQFLLDAERELVEAEDARVVAAQEQLDAAIALYKAAGGGGELREASPADGDQPGGVGSRLDASRIAKRQD